MRRVHAASACPELYPGAEVGRAGMLGRATPRKMNRALSNWHRALKRLSLENTTSMALYKQFPASPAPAPAPNPTSRPVHRGLQVFSVDGLVRADHGHGRLLHQRHKKHIVWVWIQVWVSTKVCALPGSGLGGWLLRHAAANG